MIAVSPLPFPMMRMYSEAPRPRFSIITATFNSGPLFDRTAQSIRKQSFHDFEWLVVDGASNDDTVARIQAQGDLIKHWITEKDRGISDAWNKGLAMARGDYILLLNAGDTYDSGFLNKINERAGDSCCVICSHARILTESSNNVAIFRSEPHKLYRAMHLAHNWCAVPRIHYEQIGGYADMKLAMDFEWFHRYYRRHGPAGFTIIDKPLGDYHMGGISDVNYVASFRANADILIHHGTPSHIANFWCLAYTAKHAWRSRRLKAKSQ